MEENGQDKMVIKLANEQLLESIEGERSLLNNILRRKANWIGHILKRDCLPHDIEEQMTEVKGIERRKTQFLDDFRNRRRYCQLKEEAEDRKR